MLHTVDLATAEAHGARCLDGSPPWFYYDRPRSPGGSGSNNASWLVMLDGGAWCYSLDECAARATNGLGSSLQAKQRSWVYSGLLDPSPAHNPAFASFHRVLLGYCDGGSFAGNREAALHDSSGRPVWFRGRRNLDAQLEALRGLSLAPTPSAALRGLGLADGAELLLAGGSAGGLGALFSAERVRARLPQLSRFKLLLLSAFFLHRQPEPLPRAAACRRTFDPAASSAACTPWPDKMRALYELMHASGAPGCERALPATERWRCIFANESGARLDGGVPLFLVNSAHDSWQTANVWRTYPRCRWSRCAAADVARDVRTSNRMIRSFLADLHAAGLLRRPGGGAFISSCNEHVASLSAADYGSTLVGGTAMASAIARWWHAPADAPPEQHTYLPCELDPASRAPHYECNPTCSTKRRRRLRQECPGWPC
ncbi:hypothetical protein EMIHUDRAFT_104573 [Emiliania huxleyi CCMP1516]|uniref:Pectin acetylesterase n=2 Tax=Emiliania huxleyi TaxID=2903 RepID=A0A0D3IKX1_EMIH1|nr:hypothetical protein EMIHUDRAFT_104573 [Emiliania huxleyi CCMP1516]EOD11906.1 hypothetical protein EMIHUDRAFT_104573 [Emiliania huxleyi CCMP1516]|eukprot:XP_005764335.1 hypothetical protein EMIHUDRAFT_104573 [Emiliania huxleyi CCMP1516]